MNLEDNHFYQAVQVYDPVGEVPEPVRRRILEERMMNKLSDHLSKNKASSRWHEQFSSLRMDIYVFTEDQLQELMWELSERAKHCYKGR